MLLDISLYCTFLSSAPCCRCNKLTDCVLILDVCCGLLFEAVVFHFQPLLWENLKPVPIENGKRSTTLLILVLIQIDGVLHFAETIWLFLASCRCTKWLWSATGAWKLSERFWSALGSEVCKKMGHGYDNLISSAVSSICTANHIMAFLLWRKKLLTDTAYWVFMEWFGVWSYKLMAFGGDVWLSFLVVSCLMTVIKQRCGSVKRCCSDWCCSLLYVGVAIRFCGALLSKATDWAEYELTAAIHYGIGYILNRQRCWKLLDMAGHYDECGTRLLM